ncbi:MAG TPA: hypothetical protein VKG25_04545 [Bryobacteraceae bacterium]|nr:hypothetical protein [Bryobacteraceae bacterium]
MDPTLAKALGILMRWIHIASVTSLLGSLVYARYILFPALAVLPDASRADLEKRVRSRFRPLAYLLILTTLGSGLYNYLNKPPVPSVYHMIIGMKFLLVLHIFAVTLLYTARGADEAKQKRWLGGMVISGLVIVALSAGLRFISTTQVIQIQP